VLTLARTRTLPAGYTNALRWLHPLLEC
jgi:hypothetical protein